MMELSDHVAKLVHEANQEVMDYLEHKAKSVLLVAQDLPDLWVQWVQPGHKVN